MRTNPKLETEMRFMDINKYLPLNIAAQSKGSMPRSVEQESHMLRKMQEQRHQPQPLVTQGDPTHL